MCKPLIGPHLPHRSVPQQYKLQFHHSVSSTSLLKTQNSKLSTHPTNLTEPRFFTPNQTHYIHLLRSVDHTHTINRTHSKNKLKMEWRRGPVVGRGSTATVCVAMSPTDGVFAAKSASLSESKALKREQEIHSTLSSPYVVSYKGYEISKEFNLFMEYVPGGTLADVAGIVGEPTIAFYTWRILMGLEYLTSMGIVHCDIKPRNILLGPNGPKITDFGCSRPNKAQPEISGTPVYMAPEVARGEEQGFAADVWSLGCTVTELATGKMPWIDGSDDPLAVLYRIGLSEEVPVIPGWLSEEARDFLGKCFRREVKERWTAGELLRHPFVKGYSELARTGGFQLPIDKDLVFDSPTSTLEQKIWSSLESSSSTLSSSSIGELGNRVRELGLSGKEESWGWEENWITVRTYCTWEM